MYKVMRKIMQEILWILPPKMAHKILYYRHTKKKLNLKNPKYLNEKIQYLILNEYGDKEGELTDKILVREYIKRKGDENILLRLYGTYNNADEIDWNNLPEKFVLKTNHGSGGVIVCDNKKKMDVESWKKQLNKQLKQNFAKHELEYHYKNIKPMILCEEYLNDGSGKNPKDYKIYCFNGKAKCILLCSEREEKMKIDYYDLNWNRLNYEKEGYASGKEHKCPENLKQMIKIAEDLSKGMKFVRVDLYNVNGKIYFGELTFTPAAGMIYNITDEAQMELGNYLKL